MIQLMRERRWCVRDKGKIPYMSFDVRGKADDPSTWLSYEEAKALQAKHPEKFPGLGIYFSALEENSNLCLCGIDIDALNHNADHPNPLAEEILEEFRGTYAELSPSKTGYHILLYVDLTCFSYSELDYPFYENNREQGLEAYVGTITKRYFTYSGYKLEGYNDQVTDQTDQFIEFLNCYMRRPIRRRKEAVVSEQKADKPHEIPNFDLDKRIELIRQSPKRNLFETLFDKGDTSKFISDSEADFALLCLLVPWLEGSPEMLDQAFRQSALFKNGRDEKWDSKRGTSTYGEITIWNAINVVDDPYYSEDPDYAMGDSVSPEDIVKMINDIQQDEETRDKVSVLSLACGLGKSTAISYKIAEVIKSEGTDGLIVVTDKIERMYSYAAPSNTKLSSLKDYLDLHKDEISILEHATIKEEASRQHSCRVLIMSTQRYFQRLSREQIMEYTHWDKGNRPLIIMDERPGVLEEKRLTIRGVNDVDTIMTTLQPLNDDTDELDWCTEQWEKVIGFFKSEARNYARKQSSGGETTYFFRQGNMTQMTDDDERFFNFINTNSYAFFDEKKDRLGTVRVARQLLTGWGIVERSVAKGKPSIRFYSLIDHSNKLKDIGAKVIILDGTADISPEYDSDLYDVIVSPVCRRWLDRLNIRLIKYPTTRDVLAEEDPTALAANIRDYAWRLNKGKGRRSVVFTYKAKDDGKKYLETELQALFNNEQSPCNVGHFGAIRGENVFNDAPFIIQFGLHQLPRCSYMVCALHNRPDRLNKLAEMDENKASEELKKLEKSGYIERVRSRSILVDIEQNFYRGNIRMSNSTEQMNYHIFFSIDKYPELVKLMQLRYYSLHANISQQIQKPKEFLSVADAYRKNKAPERLLQYLLGRRPGKFKYQDITAATGIVTAHISQIRSRHPDIDAILTRWQKPDNPNEFFKPPRDTKYNRTINTK